MAEFVGTVAGAMLLIYLISKAIEWAVLKRIGTSESSMVLTSTGVTFLLFVAMWVSAMGTPTAQRPIFLISYFLGAVFLAVIRLRKIKSP